MKERDEAYAEAKLLAQGSQPIAAALFLDAERSVMRRLLCASLSGGEAEYWSMVHDELKR